MVDLRFTKSGDILVEDTITGNTNVQLNQNIYNAKTIDEYYSAILEFLSSHYNDQFAKDIETKQLMPLLSSEIKDLGLDKKKNLFLIFLENAYKNTTLWNNITYDKYKIMHDMFADDKFDLRILSNQNNIFYNSNLWALEPMAFQWYLNTYNWLCNLKSNAVVDTQFKNSQMSKKDFNDLKTDNDKIQLANWVLFGDKTNTLGKLRDVSAIRNTISNIVSDNIGETKKQQSFSDIKFSRLKNDKLGQEDWVKRNLQGKLDLSNEDLKDLVDTLNRLIK